MNISWNGETWYSRLFAAIFLLGIFPSFVFYLGMRYQQVLDQYPIASASVAESAAGPVAPIVPSAYQITDASGAPYGWQQYRNERFGYELSYPETWNSSLDIGSGEGTFLNVEAMTDDGTQVKTGVSVYAQMVPVDASLSDPYSDRPEFKKQSDIVTHDGLHLQNYLGTDSSGNIEYAATTVRNGWRYSLNANVTKGYYDQNKATIDSIARSFSLFDPR